MWLFLGLEPGHIWLREEEGALSQCVCMHVCVCAGVEGRREDTTDSGLLSEASSEKG